MTKRPELLCPAGGRDTLIAAVQNGADAVYNAVVLEELSKMALMTRALNPAAGALPKHISDKHFLRKHGPNAYYGQN